MKFWIFTIVAGLLSLGVAHAEAVLVLDSEEGDYIGQGEQITLTSNEAEFQVSRNYDEGVTIYVDSPTDWWYLDFAAPYNEPLTVGAYENATRFPFQEISEPGLDVFGNHRGCNRLTGRFDILEVTYDEFGEILSFSADFEQHCEGVEPALWGSISYAIPLVLDVATSKKGRWVTADLLWEYAAETVDIYLDDILYHTVTGTNDSIRYKYNRKRGNTFQVCDAGSDRCSDAWLVEF